MTVSTTVILKTIVFVLIVFASVYFLLFQSKVSMYFNERSHVCQKLESNFKLAEQDLVCNDIDQRYNICGDYW